MGVSIAFPNARYALLNADVSRIADTKSWPNEPTHPILKIMKKILHYRVLVSNFLRLLRLLQLIINFFYFWRSEMQ